LDGDFVDPVEGKRKAGVIDEFPDEVIGDEKEAGSQQEQEAGGDAADKGSVSGEGADAQVTVIGDHEKEKEKGQEQEISKGGEPGAEGEMGRAEEVGMAKEAGNPEVDVHSVNEQEQEQHKSAAHQEVAAEAGQGFTGESQGQQQRRQV